MKKLPSIIFFGLLVFNLISGTVLAAPPQHKATGGGIVDWRSHGPVTYGFSALQVDSEGNAKGQFQFNWHEGEFKVHAKVLYLSVNDITRDAWIGVEITKSNVTAAPVGSHRVIRVRDNGESQDTISDMVGQLMGVPDASIALTQPPLALYRVWTNGNVQVR
ncbi:hypothetical protein ACFLVJ_02395 [Chloroflexota bacterium]